MEPRPGGCTKFARTVREATEDRKQGTGFLSTFEGNIPDQEGCEGDRRQIRKGAC